MPLDRRGLVSGVSSGYAQPGVVGPGIRADAVVGLLHMENDLKRVRGFHPAFEDRLGDAFGPRLSQNFDDNRSMTADRSGIAKCFE